jgi:hypothetical protein
MFIVPLVVKVVDAAVIEDTVTPPLKFIDDPVYETESILKNSPISPLIVPVALTPPVLTDVTFTLSPANVGAETLIRKPAYLPTMF